MEIDIYAFGKTIEYLRVHNAKKQEVATWIEKVAPLCMKAAQNRPTASELITMIRKATGGSLLGIFFPSLSFLQPFC